jgi:DMSO/TMAO reductase YedYZ molybdopterin-dependent catalytic subunit
VSEQQPKKAEAGSDEAGRQRPDGGRDDRLRYSRRWFLLLLGGSAAGLAGLAGLLRRHGGSAASQANGPQALSGEFPVRTAEDVSELSDATLRGWTIRIDGLVEEPVNVDYAVWSTLPRLEQTVDFHCVEGWSVADCRWAGVRPADLLALARPLPAATHIVFHAAGGTYIDALTMDQASEPSTVLADTLDDELLPMEHGGPVRLIVPTQLGYKSVKFVNRLELVDHSVRGYWEQFGYPIDAPVEGGSRH